VCNGEWGWGSVGPFTVSESFSIVHLTSITLFLFSIHSRALHVGPFCPSMFLLYMRYVSLAKDQKWKAMDVRVAVSGPSLHPGKVSLFAILIESLFSDGSFWYILFPFLLLTFPVYKDFFPFSKSITVFFLIRKIAKKNFKKMVKSHHLYMLQFKNKY